MTQIYAFKSFRKDRMIHIVIGEKLADKTTTATKTLCLIHRTFIFFGALDRPRSLSYLQAISPWIHKAFKLFKQPLTTDLAVLFRWNFIGEGSYLDIENKSYNRPCNIHWEMFVFVRTIVKFDKKFNFTDKDRLSFSVVEKPGKKNLTISGSW